MKIASIGPAHPLRGGIAKFNEALSATLIAKGHELVLFSYRYQYPAVLFPGKSQYAEEKQAPLPDIRNELHSLNFLTWRTSAVRIFKEKPDLVIVHYWMPFFAPVLSTVLKYLKRKKIKIILLAHNLIPHESQPGTRFFTRRLLKQIDALVCLSQSVTQDAHLFRPKLPAKVLTHPVYNSYGEKIKREVAIEKLGLDPDSRYLLFFGLIRKYKGLDILLNALPLVHEKGWKLIVAGEFYEDRELYTAIIDKFNLGEKLVIFDKYIPDEQVGHLFSVADLVVQPYRSATQSGVTQISYYFGVPMIVTNVGGLPEIIDHGKTGYVVPPEPHWIAKAIDEFFARNDHDSMRQAVLQKKEEYSWESFSEKLLLFIEEN